MTNKYCVWIGCKSSSKKDKNGQKFNGRWACFVKPSVNKPRALQWIRIMNRADFGLKNIKKHTFLCDKHFPAEGEGTLSGIIVETNLETGLAKKVSRLIEGGSLAK